MKNIKSLTILFLTILVSACTGHPSAAFSSSENSSSPVDERDYYDGYYSALVSWNNGEDLKNQLNTIIRNGYRPLTYIDPNYESNANADHTKYDFELLDVVYSKTDVNKSESNKGWQREHAFCASLMTGSLTADAVKNKGRATDFHNLLAANASANGSRGNKNYGVADKTNEKYQNRTVDNGNDGYSFDPKNFEPGNYDKGRLARAIFYMATMYKDNEEDSVNGITMKGLKVVEEPVTYVAGEDGAFAIGNLSTLLNWNNTYYVDYLEMQHNVSVYKDVYTSDGFAQGNRNPYIDYPELVDYVYGSKKDQAGSLKGLTASAKVLNCSEHVVDHYALKSAKREYELGTQLAENDYRVVKVYKDYSYELVNEGYTNSLSGKTFSDSDGEAIDAVITAGNDTFSYTISLNPMGNCSSGVIPYSVTGIDKSKTGVDQEVKYGNETFILNFDTGFVQNISAGGVTFGSGTSPLTKLTIKTKESYTADAAYIKVCTGNTNSSYRLTIKIGDEVLLNQAAVNNKDVFKVYGASSNSSKTGQVIFEFTGSTALKINSVAFNSIIV